MRATYGITRIDQPAKKNHGYYVRITHLGELHDKYFPDKASGSKAEALKRAKGFRDGLLVRLTGKVVPNKRHKIPQSDVPGATHVLSHQGGHVYEYWQAVWFVPGLNGRKCRLTVKYSVKRWGFDRAKLLAERSAMQHRKLTPKPA